MDPDHRRHFIGPVFAAPLESPGIHGHFAFDFFVDITHLIGRRHHLGHAAEHHGAHMLEGATGAAQWVITDHRVFVDTGGDPGVGQLQQQRPARTKGAGHARPGQFPHHGVRPVQAHPGIRYLAVNFHQLPTESRFIHPAGDGWATVAGYQLAHRVLSGAIFRLCLKLGGRHILAAGMSQISRFRTYHVQREGTRLALERHF